MAALVVLAYRMRIALFGSPGVGKGTQASLLEKRRGLKSISTGNILRAVVDSGSALGEKVRAYMEDGRLVSGPVVRKLAEEAIAAQGYDQFILDGYPRTEEQADWLTAFLGAHGAPLHAVIYLRVPTEVIVNRLSRRRVHRETGENYHLDFKLPPPDLDPGLFIQRPDDRPEAIRLRLDIYSQETRPVEQYYRQRGLLFDVDGVGGFEEVYGRIDAVLKKAALAVS